MKRTFLKSIFLFVIISTGISLAFAWGSWGHKHISRAAIFALPDSMRAFYYNHIDFVTESAVIPDLRRYVINDRAEPPRHFIDMEDFENVSISDLPKTTGDAYTKYDSAFLNKTGYLPWYIQNLTKKLTDAFRKKNKSEILFISVELSHYIADAHMPLHTSSNHDGQKTGQKGIHALWESVLPPMFGDSYNFKVAPAKYLPDVTAATWDIIAHTHSLVQPILQADMKVRKSFDKDKMYKRDAEGNLIKVFNAPIYSDEYAQQFNKELNGVVESQLRLAISAIADFWYTAWVNGGRPNLNALDDSNLFKQNRKNYKREMKAWENGKILNLSLDRED